jgi:hypothetical protein
MLVSLAELDPTKNADGAVLLNRMRTTDESNATSDLAALSPLNSIVDAGKAIRRCAYVLGRYHAADSAAGARKAIRR